MRQRARLIPVRVLALFLRRPRHGVMPLLAALVLLVLASSQARAQASAPASATSAPEAPRFDILEYEVVGNTVLPDAQVEAAVMPFMGPQLSLNDVDTARAALEKLYQAAGYLTVFVDIPEQRVDEGVVRLQVTEGRVARLSVTGARYYSQGRIRAAAAEVAEGQIPNFNALQQQLGVLNRADTRRVQPVLKPGAVPGTVDVELKVADKLPLGGSVEVNNNHAAGLAAGHVVANIHYDNFLQREHSISLTVMGTPSEPSQSRVLIGGYSVPLEGGASLSASVIGSNSNVATLGGTQALGNGTTIGLHYLRPIAMPGGGTDFWHSLSVGADYKDLKEQTIFGASVVSTPLHYLPLQLGYNGGYNSERWQSQWGLTLNYGFGQLLLRKVDNCPSANGGITPVDEFACKRSGADGSYTTAKLDTRQTLLTSWGQLSLRVAGQLANEPLQTAEQFVLGGVDSMRGYYESAALGDGGLLGSFEWKRDFSNLLRTRYGEAGSANLRELSLLAFLDWGRVYTMQALPGTPGHESLASAGLGLRLLTSSGVSLSMDYAHAMRRALPGQDTPSAILHFRLGQKL